MKNKVVNTSLGNRDKKQEIEKRQIINKEKNNKHVVNIGFININGTNITYWPDIEEEFKENKIDIIGIVETHLKNRSTWNGKYYKMIAKGREKKKKKGGGIALVIEKERNWEVEEIELDDNEDTEDILACLIENKYQKIQQFLLICCYMTTGKTDIVVQENKRKYKEIKKIVKEHRNKEILIMGDMNAHIGILGEKIDKNGEALISFAEENDLEIGNLTKTVGKITWRRPGGKEKSAIDYILFNKKCSEKIKEIIIDEGKEVDINSDHNLITVKYGNGIQENNKKEKRTKIKWKM